MGAKYYEAAGGVVIRDGLMLVLDRPQRGELRLPKGHIEVGEQARETALRETTEESGYSGLEILADLGTQTIEFDFKGNHIRRLEHYYLMRLLNDEIAERSANDEEQFVPLWLPCEDAVQQLTFNAERAVARRALEIYREFEG